MFTMPSVKNTHSPILMARCTKCERSHFTKKKTKYKSAKSRVTNNKEARGYHVAVGGTSVIQVIRPGHRRLNE